MKRSQFRIRDLLFIMVIIALAVGWWLDRSRQRSVIDGLRTEISGLRERLQPESDGDGVGDIEELHEMADSLP